MKKIIFYYILLIVLLLSVLLTCFINGFDYFYGFISCLIICYSIDILDFRGVILNEEQKNRIKKS